MDKNPSKFNDKLFFKRYIIGICHGNIQDIIRKKVFDPDIKWLPTKSFERFRADPFFVNINDGNINIFYEEFFLKDDYAGIALLTLNKDFNETDHKILLDNKSHLSFPFVFTENNRIFIFPESSKSGRLSCYEFNTELSSLTFVRHMIELPLVDSGIIKHNDRYWIFGSLFKESRGYELHVFYADNLLGPYQPHAGNPVRTGFDGIRSAGDFILVDGCIYRPSQNCENEYGESITINKLTRLDEMNVSEEPYMTISINQNNKHNRRMHTIHTLNIMGEYITVDGKYWTFSPFYKFLKFIRELLSHSN